MERIDEQEEMKQRYDQIVQEIKSVPVVLKPSPKISVGRRYHSPGADLLAEKELEFERQGIAAMKSAEESLKPCGTNRWGGVVYCGTSGDVEKIKEAKAIFSAENETEI